MVKSETDRDRSLELWLRRLRPAPGAAAGACLDAETAAAWVASGLTGPALEQAQSHVADCARCQALMGALVRADAVVQAAEPTRASRRWLGWLVPLTAAATASIAIAVWVALPRPAGQTAPSPVDAFRSPQVAEGQAAPVVAEPPADARADQRASARPAAVAPEGKAAAQGALQSGSALAKAEEGRARSLDAARLEADVAKPDVGATGGAQPLAASPAASAFADAAAANARGLRGNREAALPALEFASPDRAVRWRLVGAGVERSIDAGTSWAPAATGVTATFTTGSAPSPATCWLVGRGGVVLLTTDGVLWRRVPFPEPVDLATIVASDARTAAITTTDGRTFRTSDAGATWTR